MIRWAGIPMSPVFPTQSRTDGNNLESHRTGQYMGLNYSERTRLIFNFLLDRADFASCEYTIMTKISIGRLNKYKP